MRLDELAHSAGFRPGSRRSFVLLASLTAAYILVAAWMLSTGWVRIMATTPIRPEAVALYMALFLLTAFPLALRFLYSNFLVRQLERSTKALGAARDSARLMARSKAEFLATMSHELRTPLTAVIGFSQLLGGVCETARQREYAEAVRASSTHLLAVINDVLDYSKIEAGHVDMEFRPLEVDKLVDGCVKAVSLEAQKRGLRVRHEVMPGTPRSVSGDATRIRQVLLNLLSNALKFTDQGEIRVVTSAVRERDGRHRLTFKVQDTGIGISPEDQQRLFKAFTQLPSSRRQAGGTGLGLAISQRLCGLMGGDLTVASTPGKGSTFVATIRVTATPNAKRIAVVPGALQGLRLLVVDDDAGRAAVTRHALSLGMVVRTTGDPAQAKAWVEEGDPFDVAVLGQGPKRNARLLAETLRAAGGPDLPIVLASSRRLKALPPAFTAQVRKPVLPGALSASLAAAVGEHGMAAPPGQAAHDLRVLLVEDNALNEMLALRVLEGLGYSPDVARDGAQAVEAVTSKRYDVVLMDVQMPVMDGLEATRTIYRRVPRGERPLIVGVSANALPGDRERCLRAGMDDYTPKPIDQGRLAALLSAAHRRVVAVATPVPQVA